MNPLKCEKFAFKANFNSNFNSKKAIMNIYNHVGIAHTKN